LAELSGAEYDHMMSMLKQIKVTVGGIED
jgi:hypothetical protein